MIEDEFPDIKKNKTLIPEDVRKKTPSYNICLVERMYRWNEILAEGGRKKNDYVLLLIDALDEDFKRKFPSGEGKDIDKKSDTYKQFVLRFCDSVVKAIEYGNIIIAHGHRLGVLKVSMLKEFDDTVVNRNMAIFYKALVSTDLVKYAEALFKEADEREIRKKSVTTDQDK